MDKQKMKLLSLIQGSLVIIFVCFGIGIYFVLFSDNRFNNKALEDSSFSTTNEIIVSQQAPNTQGLLLKEQQFDSYLSRQHIQALWESFTHPTELERSYYSRGPGMAMVDLNSIRNLTNPDSLQLYLGVKIAYFCQLIPTNGIDSPENYYEGSLYSLQIYCGAQLLSHKELNDFGSKFMEQLSEKKDLEYYLGGTAIQARMVPEQNRPSTTQLKNEIEEFLKQLPSQTIKNPDDLLLVSVPLILQHKDSIDVNTRRTMGAMVLASCSSYINCTQSKPLLISGIASLVCRDETTYLPCNHLQNFEQIAQELSGGVPLEDLYSQAEEIVDQIKNHQEKELFNVFAPKP